VTGLREMIDGTSEAARSAAALVIEAGSHRPHPISSRHHCAGIRTRHGYQASVSAHRCPRLRPRMSTSLQRRWHYPQRPLAPLRGRTGTTTVSASSSSSTSSTTVLFSTPSKPTPYGAIAHAVPRSPFTGSGPLDSPESARGRGVARPTGQQTPTETTEPVSSATSPSRASASFLETATGVVGQGSTQVASASQGVGLSES